MTAPIADTDTLADVLPLLREPEGQIRTLLGLMHPHRSRAATVRIGRTGNGSYPCYRIVAGDGTEEVLGAFNDNGTPFRTAAGSVNWCTGRMDYAEVQGLLACVMADKKRPR